MRCIALYLFLFITYSAFCQKPELKRVCPNGNNNNLTWNNPTYLCPVFHFYIIWGAEKINDPFTPIDTITVDPATGYNHINASPISFYYIERRDSCGPVYNHLSDTVGIDNKPTSSTLLDSVSIDILTNKVVLGWQKNLTPDFDRYIVYRDTSVYYPIDPAGTRDTFQTDNSGSNPQSGPLKYDINTIDSCGNPSVFKNPHTTIYLTYSIDTCTKKVSLSWTHYKGWRSIGQYEIYENAGAGITQVGTVAGNITSYNRSIVLGNLYEYFVRAVKDTTIRVSSSSNKISFTTRKRLDPEFTRINYVTTDNKASNDIVFNFSSDAAAETKYFSVVFSDLNLVEKERLTLNKSDLNTDIHSSLKNTSRYLLKIFSHDLCDSISGQTDTSTNILLSKEEDTEHRSLKWNSYFTWNTGVEKYMIYRGTGEEGNYMFSLWQETFDTSIADSEAFENVLAYGICYYVKALKAETTDTISESNIVCFPSPFTVFIPNAFVPTGINNIFRPEGSSIDYQASTIQIYDRWGKLIYSGPIGRGWDGTDNGQLCMDGIYHYTAEIISIKNERQIKNGTVTLLR